MLKCHWLRYLSKQKRRNQIGIAGGITIVMWNVAVSGSDICSIRKIFSSFLSPPSPFFLLVVLGICWHFPSLYLLSRRKGWEVTRSLWQLALLGYYTKSKLWLWTWSVFFSFWGKQCYYFPKLNIFSLSSKHYAKVLLSNYRYKYVDCRAVLHNTYVLVLRAAIL